MELMASTSATTLCLLDVDVLDRGLEKFFFRRHIAYQFIAPDRSSSGDFCEFQATNSTINRRTGLLQERLDSRIHLLRLVVHDEVTRSIDA